MSDPYWTLDTSLFEGTFRYFGRDPVQVRGKIHTEQERYRRSDVNQEITPIAVTQGTRIYLHMRPFVLIPDIVLTIGLYRQPQPGGAVGEVTSSQERRQKEVEIGNVQAWSYPDGTLVLWECFLHDFVRTLPLTADVNQTCSRPGVRIVALTLCGKRSLKNLRRLLKHRKSQKQTAHGFSFVSPASLARIIASARPATCSLLKMEETWLRTVLGLSTSCSAMAGLV